MARNLTRLNNRSLKLFRHIIKTFYHFHSYGTVLKDDNNLVSKAVNKISANETQLHDRLIIEIVQNNMEKERLHFLILQSQHMLAIRGILTKSEFEEDMKIIEGALLET